MSSLLQVILNVLSKRTSCCQERLEAQTQQRDTKVQTGREVNLNRVKADALFMNLAP